MKRPLPRLAGLLTGALLSLSLFGPVGARAADVVPGEVVVTPEATGAPAAGAANAINCYLDRDIDEIMVRTRRRPLPAHAVAPEDALVFGLIHTVISFGLLAVTTNLGAAFLTLLAIGF